LPHVIIKAEELGKKYIIGHLGKGSYKTFREQMMQHLHERVQADLDKLPKVIHFSLDGDHWAIFDGFARIGLTFTRRIGRLRHAYRKAIEAVMVPAGQPASPSRLLKHS